MELALYIYPVEAEKCHNGVSVSWTPRRAGGAVPEEVRRLENQELCWCKSLSQGRRPMSQLTQAGREQSPLLCPFALPGPHWTG